MSRKQILSIAAALSCLGMVLSAQAGPPRSIAAVFSEDDPQFSETITLYADGKYQQAETEKKADLYQKYSVYSGVDPLPNLSSPALVFSKFERDPKRTGAWRVLDKEDGQPIAFKTLADLPKNAVIEVKGAMPFGITWERQRPYFLRSDRTLPASAFQAAPPAPSK